MVAATKTNNKAKAKAKATKTTTVIEHSRKTKALRPESATKISSFKRPREAVRDRSQDKRKAKKRSWATVTKAGTFNPIPSEPVDLSDALTELRTLANATYDVVLPSRFKRALRPSGLPYCPILDVTKVEERTFKQDFYLDIGTAFHAVVQEFISRSRIARSMVYATFKCTRCNTVEKFKPLPYSCFTCGAPDHMFKYDELEFDHFRGLGGGHIDLFVRTSAGWLVCDWKTTSERARDSREEVDNKHHHQLQAYCLAVAELYAEYLQGLPIIGYALMFAPRDHPGKTVKGKLTAKMTAEQEPERMETNWNIIAHPFHERIARRTRKRLHRSYRGFNAATKALETNKWDRVVKLRPCRTIADFNKPMGMSDAFYKAKACPNLDACTTMSDDKLAAKLAKEVPALMNVRKKQFDAA